MKSSSVSHLGNNEEGLFDEGNLYRLRLIGISVSILILWNGVLSRQDRRIKQRRRFGLAELCGSVISVKAQKRALPAPINSTNGSIPAKTPHPSG